MCFFQSIVHLHEKESSTLAHMSPKGTNLAVLDSLFKYNPKTYTGDAKTGALALRSFNSQKLET
jgi:hypothetical protein